MHMSTSMEIRNFAVDQYFVGAAGQMPGSSNFSAEAVVRILGPMPLGEGVVPQFVFGNITTDGDDAGWAFVIGPAIGVDGQRILLLSFSMSGSTGLSAQARIALGSVMGKTLHLQGVVQTFDAGEGTTTSCTLYVNGVELATANASDWTPLVSAAVPSVGYSATGPFDALQVASVLSVGYTELVDPTTDYNTMSTAIAGRFLEIMKRAELIKSIDTRITDTGELSNVYDVYVSGFGVPSVLTNKGSSAPTENMTKEGAGTSLITTAAYTEWGCPVVVHVED